jgi:hypothetical protein
MARTSLSIRVRDSTKDKLDRIADRDGITRTEAMRTTLEHGLNYLGYNGGQSRFQQLVTNVATGLFHAGATILLLSLFGSLGMLVIGVSIMCGALGVIGLGRVLSKKYDPYITQQLPEVHIE